MHPLRSAVPGGGEARTYPAATRTPTHHRDMAARSRAAERAHGSQIWAPRLVRDGGTRPGRAPAETFFFPAAGGGAAGAAAQVG